MKTLLLLLAFVATSAFAGTENMVAQCEAVMRCDICRIQNDTRARPSGILVTIKGANGPELRRISSAGYDWLRNAGSDKRGSRYEMCARVAEAMKEPITSEHNFVARSMFAADWKKQAYCP